MSTRTFTFEERLYGALHAARSMRPVDPAKGREHALVITKLEEAVMWNDTARVKAGLPSLGLDWKP